MKNKILQRVLMAVSVLAICGWLSYTGNTWPALAVFALGDLLGVFEPPEY